MRWLASLIAFSLAVASSCMAWICPFITCMPLSPPTAAAAGFVPPRTSLLDSLRTSVADSFPAVALSSTAVVILPLTVCLASSCDDVAPATAAARFRR